MNPTDGYIAYIVNPKSGASSGKRMISSLADYIKQNGFDMRTSLTESLEHCRQLVRQAAQDDKCQLVIVAGGDGSVRQAVQALQATGKPLLILPGGTENLLANELGIDGRTDTLIKAFCGNCIRSLDLGSADGRYFTCIAGFGFDGDIIKFVNSQRLGHISHMDYFWPIWRTFWTHSFPIMDIKIDGEQIFNGSAMVFVGNISRYAVGLEILDNANYSDGLLDVCIYKCDSRIRLAKHSLMTLLKKHSNCSDVIYKQGKCIEITSPDPNVNTQLDGDPGPTLPLKINIIPNAVNLLVPPNAKPAGIRTRLMRILQ